LFSLVLFSCGLSDEKLIAIARGGTHKVQDSLTVVYGIVAQRAPSFQSVLKAALLGGDTDSNASMGTKERTGEERIEDWRVERERGREIMRKILLRSYSLALSYPLSLQVGAITGGLRGKVAIPQHYVEALVGANELKDVALTFASALLKK
jgi:hypothetical protein